MSEAVEHEEGDFGEQAADAAQQLCDEYVSLRAENERLEEQIAAANRTCERDREVYRQALESAQERNAKLEEVAEAAREYIDRLYNWENPQSATTQPLKNALAELEEE